MSKNIIFIFGLLVIFIVIAFSCSNDKNPTKSDDNVTVDPSFANEIQPIFNSNCAISGCHSNASKSANLSLASGEAYDNLVNVNSTQNSSKKRVVPGDAENSYLVIKIEANQPGISKMPPSGSLSSNQIQLIKNWINKGANDN